MANRDLLMSNNDIGSSRSNLYKSTPIPKKKKVIPNRVKRLVDNAVEAISELDLNNEWNSILNANYILLFLLDLAIDFQNELKALNELYIEYIKLYRLDHPFSLTWSDADIINFERNGQPMYDQSLYLTAPGSKGIIYPDSYKEYVPEVTIDNPTNFRPNLSIPELARQYEYLYWLNNERPKELEELLLVGDIINGGISKIPLVNNWWWAPAFINAGLDNRYSRLTGLAYTPYTLPTIGNSVTAAFMSPMSTYRLLTTQLGEFAGNYIGGDTGRFFGGIAGMSFPEVWKWGTKTAWPWMVNLADRAGLFIPKEGTWTRGIGRGTEGIQDLAKTGIVRGNPRGTEVTAHEFAGLYRRNRNNFKDIMLETGIPDIENKFFSRTLTEEEFNAIKKVVLKHEAEQTSNKVGNIVLETSYDDPLYKYNTYEDYVKQILADVAHVESMPNRIASGEVQVNTTIHQTPEGARAKPIEERFGPNSDYVADGLPLAYYYPDGRNPFIKGHDYAGSNYAVRVNNPEKYGPFMHTEHLHPSFLRSPLLMDPEVEVYRRLPFGLGWRMNKSKLLKFLPPVRLYRANPRNAYFRADMAENGTALEPYVGMWFTDNPEKGAWYANNYMKGRNPYKEIDLQYIDIPRSELEQYRASRILPKGFEYEPEDFIIPWNIERHTVPFETQSLRFLDILKAWNDLVKGLPIGSNNSRAYNKKASNNNKFNIIRKAALLPSLVAPMLINNIEQ